MIASIYLTDYLTEFTKEKIKQTSQLVTKLQPIINSSSILVLVNQSNLSTTSLFNQELSKELAHCSSNDCFVCSFDKKESMDTIQEFTKDSQSVVLNSTVETATIELYQEIFSTLTTKEMVIFDGNAKAIQKALSGDIKPYAICLKEEELHHVLSLSKEVVKNSLPTETLTDPLFEDVPVVLIYNKHGNGYLSYKNEIYSIFLNDTEQLTIIHEGVLLGLAKGLESQSDIDTLLKTALICGVSSAVTQDVLFDEHYFDDKISIVKLA